MGGAVWRFWKRRADDHRSIHRGLGRQVEADVASRDALAAWLRRTRAGTFQRASRALSATVRGEQSTGLLSDDARAIFPLAATASETWNAATARRNDAEEPAAFAGSDVEYRGAGERRFSAVDRRC